MIFWELIKKIMQFFDLKLLFCVSFFLYHRWFFQDQLVINSFFYLLGYQHEVSSVSHFRKFFARLFALCLFWMLCLLKTYHWSSSEEKSCIRYFCFQFPFQVSHIVCTPLNLGGGVVDFSCESLGGTTDFLDYRRDL